MENKDIITLARELGAAMQKSDEYIRFSIARQAADEDETLQKLKDKFLEDYYFCPVPAGTTGWETRERPAGTYAVLIHRGPYRSEPEAVRRLRDWVLENGYALWADSYDSQPDADRQAHKAMPISVALTLAGSLESVVINVNVQV